MANNIAFPHDRLFKSIMSNSKAMQEFFEQNLPTNVRNAINLTTIEAQKESYIDNHLRAQMVDLLYAVEFNNQPGYLYLLIEHQSTCDELMAFRLIKYMMAIMDEHLKKTKQNILPVVYPMILYSGERKYRCSTDLFDLFGEHKQLARDILWHPFRLVDLSQIPDEELKKSIWYGVGAYLMKHIFEKEVRAVFENVVELLKPIDKAGDTDYIMSIISYVAEVNEIDKEILLETVKAALPTVKEKIMTAAEQWRQEGRQEGVHEGELKALKTIARKLLSQGRTTDEVVVLTGLSTLELEQLKSQVIN
jgi:predicted transposase/invertase (TIGR01784 family)